MSDFLKKLKTSVEKGELNDEIVNHHYEVLQTADMLDLLKNQKTEESAEYNEQLRAFANGEIPNVPHDMNLLNTELEAVVDDQHYLDELLTVDDKEILKNKIEKANQDAAILEIKRKKRELIEMNTAHIDMLEKENETLNKKITKNKDLIEYLKLEMERA